MSEDGLYRYTLLRRWGDGHPLVWIMLNPSTADHAQDDPTIRRVIRFTRDAGHAAALVVNLYAIRATDPAAMLAHPHRVGPENDEVLGWARQEGPMVAAWGTRAEPKRVARVLAGPLDHAPLWALGTTKHGHPKHPLYVPASTPLASWRSAPTTEARSRVVRDGLWP
jgi:hypothetical protein